MSKRDFEAIANCLNANHAPLALVQDFADMLGEANPRFRRDLFISACTVNLSKNLTTDLRILDREIGK